FFLTVLLDQCGAWLRDSLRLALQRESELNESEERVRVAFATFSDAIVMTRVQDGVFLTVNEGFTRLSGWAAAEAIGKSALQLGLWAEPRLRAQFLRTLQEGGSISNLEIVIRRRDGSTFVGLISAQAVTVKGTRYALVITRDIT